MHVNGSCQHLVVGGVDQLTRAEEHLLDTLADLIGSCPCCGTRDQFLALWTPERNVALVLCVCGTPLWTALP